MSITSMLGALTQSKLMDRGVQLLMYRFHQHIAQYATSDCFSVSFIRGSG